MAKPNTNPPIAPKFDLGLSPGLEKILKRALALDRAEKILENLRSGTGARTGMGGELRPFEVADSVDFCQRALSALGASVVLPGDAEIKKLRAISGPLIFVANHPLGAVEALSLICLMGEIRSKFKFVANALLKVLHELDPILLPVDIMEGEGKAEANIRTNLKRMRNVLRFLDEGGMVGVFPSGEVAAIQSLRSREVTEIPWKSHVGRFVQKSEATVVPLFFEGQNSALFQYLGYFTPKVRIPLLVREMLNYRRPVIYKIGEPISFSEMSRFQDAESLTLFLRDRTYALKVHT